MSAQSKYEYLIAIPKRYQEASKPDKTLIPDEFCTVCGYHRNCGGHSYQAVQMLVWLSSGQTNQDVDIAIVQWFHEHYLYILMAF